jgi:putative methylase
MKKQTLERLLQGIPPLANPSVQLEQYSTPADIGADVLFEALSHGDIEGRKVLDLGCGNGMFAIGAAMLRSNTSVGVDLDPSALQQARKNANDLGVNVEFVRADVGRFSARADTVIMNPPFGAQNRGADRPFLLTAMSVAEVVYSIHMAETEDFLLRTVRDSGFSVDFQKRYKFEIPHMFAFHTKTKKNVEVMLLCVRKLGDRR